MDVPPDAIDDSAAANMETTADSTMTHEETSQFDVTSTGSVAPVFVPSEDGSMIYRSFRVREAKVCETGNLLYILPFYLTTYL